jgi:hypothetical protein
MSAASTELSRFEWLTKLEPLGLPEDLRLKLRMQLNDEYLAA